METDEIILLGMQMKKLIEKKSAPIIRKYDLRPVELDILVFLSQSHGKDTAKDIMNSRYISKAHISKSIENLRMRGFVRLSEDPDDHRILHIGLTEQTADVVREVLDVYQSCRQAMMRHISTEELTLIHNLWNKALSGINDELGKY